MFYHKSSLLFSLLFFLLKRYLIALTVFNEFLNEIFFVEFDLGFYIVRLLAVYILLFVLIAFEACHIEWTHFGYIQARLLPFGCTCPVCGPGMVSPMSIAGHSTCLCVCIWLAVCYYSLASYPYHVFFVACFGDDLDVFDNEVVLFTTIVTAVLTSLDFSLLPVPWK